MPVGPVIVAAPGALPAVAAQPAPAVLLLDDDALATEAVARLLRSAGYRANALHSAGACLEAAPDRRLACIVLECVLPDLCGIELMAELGRRGRLTSHVFLTSRGDVKSTVRAMRQGAVDVLEKPAADEVLLDAVARAVARTTQERSFRAEQEAALARLARLTSAERTVCEHLAGGLRNREVAAALGRSEQTIKVHAWKAMRKLSVGSAVEVARLLDLARVV